LTPLPKIAPASVALAGTLVVLFAACAYFGGATSSLDTAISARADVLRANSPLALNVALFLTMLGSAPVTLGIGALGAILLFVRRQGARAAILLAAIVAERLVIVGLKLSLGRARPEFDTRLVHVNSFSFPSGHAANSLTAWVLLACFVVPVRLRPAAIAAAFVIALAVGMTRVLLGVHWPSDVVGGWSAGLLAVLLALAADSRLAGQKQ
jgi:undecaprenyl-diphosphatase